MAGDRRADVRPVVCRLRGDGREQRQSASRTAVRRRAGAAAAASITGLGRSRPPLITVNATPGWFALALLFALVTARRLRGGNVAPLAWAAAAGAIALWAAAALAYFPSREADQSRFQYYSAALLLLVLVASFDGWRPRPRDGTILAGCDGGRSRRRTSRSSTPPLRAGERTARSRRRRVERCSPPATTCAPTSPPSTVLVGTAIEYDGLLSVTAGPLYRTVDHYGSPAGHPSCHRASAGTRARGGRSDPWHRRGGGPPPQLRISDRQAPLPTRRSGRGGDRADAAAGTVYAQTLPGSVATLQIRRFAARYRFLNVREPSEDREHEVFIVPKIALAAGAPVSVCCRRTAPHCRGSAPHRTPWGRPCVAPLSLISTENRSARGSGPPPRVTPVLSSGVSVAATGGTSGRGSGGTTRPLVRSIPCCSRSER